MTTQTNDQNFVSLSEFDNLLKNNDFLYVKMINLKQEILFDTKSKFFWCIHTFVNFTHNTADSIIKRDYNIGWKLPSKDELLNFFKAKNNPFMEKVNNNFWLCLGKKCIDLQGSEFMDFSGGLIVCNKSAIFNEIKQVYGFFADNVEYILTIDKKNKYEF